MVLAKRDFEFSEEIMTNLYGNRNENGMGLLNYLKNIYIMLEDNNFLNENF